MDLIDFEKKPVEPPIQPQKKSPESQNSGWEWAGSSIRRPNKKFGGVRKHLGTLKKLQLHIDFCCSLGETWMVGDFFERGTYFFEI